MQKLTEEFDEETGLQYKKFMAYPWILTITWPISTDDEDYPLIKPGPYWKKFRANFCEFTAVLVQQCQYSVIYDGYLLDTIISLLLGLADSCVRAFRHTSTLSAMKLLTALVRVILNLDISIDNSQRLYQVEKTRPAAKRTTYRLEQLEQKRKELQQKHHEIEDMMNALFKGTFVQRYRDVVSEIRALCIEEIGTWMKMYPQTYLNDSCLKYIGWMLYDKIPEVRLKSLMALHGLYDKKDLVSKMDLFTCRFKDRIVSMTLDRDHDVTVQAMRLLVNMSQHCEDVFTTEDCDILYQFVYATHRPLAAAAGEFLYKRLLNPQVAGAEINVQRTMGTELKSSQLTTLLTFFCESELHDHLTYLVDSLWDCTPSFLKDWQCMSSTLLQDTTEEDGALNATKECLLIELILASVRQAVEGHPPVARGTARKVLSAKEKKVQVEDCTRITEHFAGTLPVLLVKYSLDPVNVTNLLQIVQYFDMEVYAARCMDNHLDALLKQLRHIVVHHSDTEVLEACSKAYCSLGKEELASHLWVSLSKRQLIDQLVDTFNQMLDDILQEGEELWTAEDVHPMSCTLRRLAAFHNAHNLSPWNLLQRTSQLLLFDMERRSLPVQVVLPAFQCMYYALLWQLVPVIEETHSKGELVSSRTQVTRFWQMCRHYLNHEDKSVREQLFQKQREVHGTAIQPSSSFTNIKELARRFSLTFGMDNVKCRESVAMMHKRGIEFAFREVAVEDRLPPPNLAFLILISEFSSKLLKADKRLVYGYLQRFAGDRMLLYKGEEWHPLIVYSNSLLDHQDEESSITGSSSSKEHVSSSRAQHLKRKPSREYFPEIGLREQSRSEAQMTHCPVKNGKRQKSQEKKSEDSMSLHLLEERNSYSHGPSINPPSPNTYADEGNEDVDVDVIDTDQEIAVATEKEDQEN
ncbi:hypothetical protein FKM82_009001 [Ascaphus truei]